MLTKLLQDVLHWGQIALTFIGGGTVLRFFAWLFQRRKENFEDAVLGMFAKGQKSRTTDGIYNDYRGAVIGDIPMWAFFPIHTTKWGGLKWRVRTVPYHLRHWWRLSVFMPSKAKVERTVLHLWKNGLLIRDPINPQHYRLKS
jgi:hypothetical protein